MSGPSLYKPRKTVGPENGSDVDTSVNYLIVGVVALLLFLATLIGMMGFGAGVTTSTTESDELRPRAPIVDIGANPGQGG